MKPSITPFSGAAPSFGSPELLPQAPAPRPATSTANGSGTGGFPVAAQAKSRQRNLLAAMAGKGPACRRGAADAEAIAQFAATAMLEGGTVAQLAALLVPPETTVGPDRHTLREECALFSDFQPAGFLDERGALSRTESLLQKAFGLTHPGELPGAVATAATRIGSAFHLLARQAIQCGAIASGAKLGFDTTFKKELELFPPFTVGF